MTGSDLPPSGASRNGKAFVCEDEPGDESPGGDISSLVTSAADATEARRSVKLGNGFSKAALWAC